MFICSGLTGSITTALADPPVCVEDPFALIGQENVDPVCDGSRGGTGSGSDAGSGRTGTWPPEGWVPYLRVATAPDGSYCVTTDYHPPGLTAEDVNIYDGGTRTPDGAFPQCPPAEGAGEPQSAAALAAHYWERIPLPRPEPHIAPGWAITGKLAYLETRGRTTYEYTNSTPFGQLVIRATGRYYVDWGDGETTGPHSREGRPWPEGEITHDYIWARTYDIVVTERWTAEWTIGNESGTLRELRTTGRIDDFRAREIQAVVRS